MTNRKAWLGVILMLLVTVGLTGIVVGYAAEGETDPHISLTIHELTETPDGVYTYATATSAYDEVWIEVQNPRDDVHHAPTMGLPVETEHVSCDACGLSIRTIDNGTATHTRSTVDVYGGQTVVIKGTYNGTVHVIDKRDLADS